MQLRRRGSEVSELQVQRMSVFVMRYSYVFIVGVCICTAYIVHLSIYPDVDASVVSMDSMWIISVLSILLSNGASQSTHTFTLSSSRLIQLLR